MNKSDQNVPSRTMVEEITDVVNTFQKQNTGHTPTAVTVVLSEDTLVITLHEALSPAERALAKTTEGAAQIQEFHRQLFAASSKTLRQEIQKITGREIREATAEVEPKTGVIIHAFTTGTVVQVFLLENEKTSGTATTQEVDWDWAEDGEDGKDETIDRNNEPAPQDDKKRISSENQTDQ